MTHKLLRITHCAVDWRWTRMLSTSKIPNTAFILWKHVFSCAIFFFSVCFPIPLKHLRFTRCCRMIENTKHRVCTHKFSLITVRMQFSLIIMLYNYTNAMSSNGVDRRIAHMKKKCGTIEIFWMRTSRRIDRWTVHLSHSDEVCRVFSTLTFVYFISAQTNIFACLIGSHLYEQTHWRRF